jgi:hypothetical protein
VFVYGTDLVISNTGLFSWFIFEVHGNIASNSEVIVSELNRLARKCRYLS